MNNKLLKCFSSIKLRLPVITEHYDIVDMCGVEGKRRTLFSKLQEIAPTSRHKTYRLCAVVGQ